MNLALPLIASLLLQATPAPSPDPQATPTPKPLPVGPTVVLETTLGTVKLVLDKEKAPLTVDNFLKYVRAKHYDGTIFHRVMPGFMAQGGGMDVQMTEKVVRAPIRNEAANGLHNARGTIAMARTNDPNSATAQFFINVKDNFKLDYGMTGAGYAVFGQVVEGMEVVDAMVAVATTAKGPHANVPMVPIVIKSARELGAPAASPSVPKPPAATKPAPSPSPKE